MKHIQSLQDERAIWLFMSVIMGGLVVLAHSFFQNYLYMPPCEQCVYIRFSMSVMAIGGLIAAINPKKVILKLAGYIFGFYGAITGIMYCLRLNAVHIAVHAGNPFGVKGCSSFPTFPFNLPLDSWLPGLFKPTGDCGFDNPLVPDGVSLSSIQAWFVDLYANGWYLLPSLEFMNMAIACLIVYAIAIILLGVMFFSWIIRLKK
ncbi:protein disulfide oxidoreductase [Campylobacter iguaniorum]|uniref:Putative protein-disulfide oxidoreductase DsbI n=1 Tax=Campylobacter iguaniorum TaxID=1244531 RepID=A0A076F870_9BACT|nr:protein-disulfide oxidoreductase DsbI [Campylobacter iguaniorum]AII14405.1 protein disulfide oxidoreductase [Campylobacter iguaniorum]ALV24140.1 protein disulfide oxidoreductase [Campylobacter iguaniorum]